MTKEVLKKKHNLLSHIKSHQGRLTHTETIGNTGRVENYAVEECQNLNIMFHYKGLELWRNFIALQNSHVLLFV